MVITFGGRTLVRSPLLYSHMIARLFLPLLGLLCAACTSSQLPNNAEQLVFHDAKFDVYRVNLNHAMPRLYWKNIRGENFGALGVLRDSLEARGEQVIFATNAGMYSPEHIPVGLHIADGALLHPIDTGSGDGNFYLQPNGVFFIGASGSAGIAETPRFSAAADTIVLATQSGPMLVTGGNIHPVFNPASTSTFIRSGVGVESDSVVVFAISNTPITLYHFASLFRDRLHCQNALYLDGYVSRMYLPALGRTETDGEFTGIIAVTEKK